jgi:hypothetical protein
MKTSISSILQVNPFTAPFNFTSYQVGSCKSGEIANEATVVMRMPGLKSTPNSCGSVNSAGVFTASTTSQYSSQAINIEGSTYWITLGIRDNRTEANLPQDPTGSTRLFAEASTPTSIFLDINGNIFCTVSGANNTFTVVAPKINLGSSSPGDNAALASKVKSNFTQVATAAQAYLTTAPTTLPQVISALGAFMTSLTTPAFEDTKSNIVLISG